MFPCKVGGRCVSKVPLTADDLRSKDVGNPSNPQPEKVELTREIGVGGAKLREPCLREFSTFVHRWVDNV